MKKRKQASKASSISPQLLSRLLDLGVAAGNRLPVLERQLTLPPLLSKPANQRPA